MLPNGDMSSAKSAEHKGPSWPEGQRDRKQKQSRQHAPFQDEHLRGRYTASIPSHLPSQAFVRHLLVKGYLRDTLSRLPSRDKKRHIQEEMNNVSTTPDTHHCKKEPITTKDLFALGNLPNCGGPTRFGFTCLRAGSTGTKHFHTKWTNIFLLPCASLCYVFGCTRPCWEVSTSKRTHTTSLIPKKSPLSH